MRLSKCQFCDQILYFENHSCISCGRRLGYSPERTDLFAMEPACGGWRVPSFDGEEYRLCANAEYDACNWLIPGNSANRFCLACRHNRMIPDLSDHLNLARWRTLEAAKHRLFYALLRLQLRPQDRIDNPEGGLVFDFIDDPLDGARVLTGHDDGVITIALREANAAERERARLDLGEPYRTAIGHFRHEIGHYFWDQLVRDSDRIGEFRALFGDESRDYNAALAAYYRTGAPADWQNFFVSEYAASHPWEDFAETWAHYLHIVDTLETAAAYGICIRPLLAGSESMAFGLDCDPYANVGTQKLIDAWIPLSFAVNSINRSMGHLDLYPFVLSPSAVTKLDFVNRLVHSIPK